jgi:CheY-like chemotaxis protein
MSQTKKILIIDDEKSHQVMMKAWLNLLDLNDVDVASSGREALLSVSRTNYSMIFLDISLPDIDGYEVCRRIRNRGKGKTVPIIINTIRPMARQVWRKVGASGVSLKPLMFHHLEYFIDRWLQPIPAIQENTNE